MNILAQDLGRKAKELVEGMQNRCGRNPDIADFAAGFQKILEERSFSRSNPASASVKCARCARGASFIVNREALCIEHWKEKRNL